MTHRLCWGLANPHPLSTMRTELVWEGKYDEHGHRREVGVGELAMPMQRIETVDEPRQPSLFEQQIAKGSTGVSPVMEGDCVTEDNHGQDARAPSLCQGQDAREPAESPFLNPFEDIERHWHNLPHWQQGEKWQFVTWRLGDSLPKAMIEQWTAEKEAWLKHHPQPWDEATEKEYHNQYSERIDEGLDAGHGSCTLRDPRCANIVAEAFHHFAGERYDLGAFVVMPNHVHTLFLPKGGHALEDIVHSWKSYTAKEINKVLGKRGALWQEDYWDRMVRHEAHFAACLRYVEENPIKAKLRSGEFVSYRSTGILPVTGTWASCP